MKALFGHLLLKVISSLCQKNQNGLDMSLCLTKQNLYSKFAHFSLIVGEFELI